MLPVGLLVEIDRLRGELGMSRNALLSMAAARFAVEMASAIVPANRGESLDAVEKIFTETLEKVRRSA